MGELLEYLAEHEPQFRRRLGALYSDFSQLRTTNPDGYTANVEAWQKGLADAARAGHIPNRGASGDSFILKLDDELLRALETKECGRPLALGTVVREAIAKKDFIPIQDFTAAKKSIYTNPWGVSPWTVVSWSLRQLGLAEGGHKEDKIPNGKLIIVQNLEAASKALCDQAAAQTSRTDGIMSRKLFTQQYGKLLGNRQPLSDADIEILLRYLSRDKQLVAYDGNTVKIKRTSDTNVSISEEDSTIAALKTLMVDMEYQLDILSKKVDILGTTARDAVAKKNRVSALAALRSKKMAEANLARQSATLSQLEEVYSSISQATDQIELVRIMEGSTGVLKKLNATVGGVERVEDLVDELHEQMTLANEVNEAIGQAGHAGAVDEGEVDDELEAMEAAVEHQKEEEDRIEREARSAEQVAETASKLVELERIQRAAESHRANANGRVSHEEELKQSTLEGAVKGLRRLSLEAEPAG